MRDMSDADLARRVRDLLAASCADRVQIGIGPHVGIGMHTSDGRMIGVAVRPDPDGVRVTDGGESWAGLWGEGLVDSRPTSRMLARLTRICAAFGLVWDAERNEIAAVVADIDEVPDVALRVCAASIAIDSWRVWL